jgi:hypothetical protein
VSIDESSARHLLNAVEAGRGTVPNKSETYFAVVEMELLIEAKHVSVPSIV